MRMLNRQTKCALGLFALALNMVLPSTSSATTGGSLNLPPDPITYYADGSINTFYEINLSGVPAGFTVSNGLYGAWCIDYFHPTSPTGNFMQGTLRSSLDPNLPAHLQSESWNRINYILNNKQGNRDDVQLALWYFTDGVNWGITPNAANMINAATANGAGFTPAAGQLTAVVIDQGDTPPAQVTIIEVPRPPQGTPEPPQQENCEDKVTGGGWIIAPGGKKANFGVQGGRINGRLWGGLNYVDHNTGMHVQGRTPTSYTVVNANTRRMTYNVTVDGRPGTMATVTVTDNGEPGRNDIFEIRLSSGYSAGGDLGSSRPGGGNIQLHKTKCK